MNNNIEIHFLNEGACKAPRCIWIKHHKHHLKSNCFLHKMKFKIKKKKKNFVQLDGYINSPILLVTLKMISSALGIIHNKDCGYYPRIIYDISWKFGLVEFVE